MTDQNAALHRFSTRSFGSWQRFGRSHFSPVDIVAGRDRGWSSRLESVTGGGFQFSRLAASSHRVVWDNPLRAPSSAHRMRLIRITEGRGRVLQDDRAADLRAGDFALYDDSRPYALEFDADFRSVLLTFPKHRLEIPYVALGVLTAVPLSGRAGLGRVTSSYLGEVGAELAEIGGDAWTGAQQAAMSLLSATLASQLGTRRRRDSAYDEFLAACECIDANLSDPGLTSLVVAREMFTSRRRLQQLFKDEGLTVSEYIRARRLERARLALEDPDRESTTIAQIAYECGIDNPAYFSRIFNETYGLSPREHRAAARGAVAS